MSSFSSSDLKIPNISVCPKWILDYWVYIRISTKFGVLDVCGFRLKWVQIWSTFSKMLFLTNHLYSLGFDCSNGSLCSKSYLIGQAKLNSCWKWSFMCSPDDCVTSFAMNGDSKKPQHTFILPLNIQEWRAVMLCSTWRLGAVESVH